MWVLLYAAFQQAHRSIDHSLGATWSELQEFYCDEWLVFIRSLAPNLGLPELANPDNVRSDLRELEYQKAYNLYVCLASFPIRLLRGVRALRSEDRSFIAACHSSLFIILSRQDISEEDLIQFRMDICCAMALIVQHCFVRPSKWKLADMVESFHQPDFRTHHSLVDIARML